MTQSDLTEALSAAGFSLRTINALVNGMRLKTIEHLRTSEWGSSKVAGGLAWELRAVPKLGPAGIAEVEAFRATGDARNAQHAGPTLVTARMTGTELQKLDHWANARGLTRAQAVHAIVIKTLFAETEEQDPS